MQITSLPDFYQQLATAADTELHTLLIAISRSRYLLRSAGGAGRPVDGCAAWPVVQFSFSRQPVCRLRRRIENCSNLQFITHVITGAAGHTGHAIAETLLRTGQAVMVIDQLTDTLADLVKLRANPANALKKARFLKNRGASLPHAVRTGRGRFAEHLGEAGWLAQ